GALDSVLDPRVMHARPDAPESHEPESKPGRPSHRPPLRRVVEPRPPEPPIPAVRECSRVIDPEEAVQRLGRKKTRNARVRRESLGGGGADHDLVELPESEVDGVPMRDHETGDAGEEQEVEAASG